MPRWARLSALGTAGMLTVGAGDEERRSGTASMLRVRSLTPGSLSGGTAEARGGPASGGMVAATWEIRSSIGISMDDLLLCKAPAPAGCATGRVPSMRGVFFTPANGVCGAVYGREPVCVDAVLGKKGSSASRSAAASSQRSSGRGCIAVCTTRTSPEGNSGTISSSRKA